MSNTSIPPYPYTALHKRKGGFNPPFSNLPDGVKVETSGEYAIIYAPNADALDQTEAAAFCNSRGTRGWGVA